MNFEHTVAIVANGVIEDYPKIASLIKAHAEVIAVNGGSLHCHKMGIRPDLIIGDCDSLDPKTAKAMSSVPIRCFPSEKDETDLELAVQATYTPEIKKITLFGALQKRTDHTLSNLHLIRRYPRKVFIENEIESLFAFDGAIDIKCEPGQTISFIQLGDPVRGVSSKGLKWELQDASFNKYFFSLSNICLSDTVSITISEGDLICCLLKEQIKS